MKFNSIDTWYFEYRDWTGFVVQRPVSGMGDEITKSLLGEHEIDGEAYNVVAVENQSETRFSERSHISLMVRGKVGKSHKS
jgi:hypothetical protein